ncbi:MAG: hypothetical protein M1839_001577 [Geoglossum umbratile]|nr:MAG: hypothetical protein M1839_001577 [Geoglossum umbratile]
MQNSDYSSAGGMTEDSPAMPPPPPTLEGSSTTTTTTHPNPPAAVEPEPSPSKSEAMALEDSSGVFPSRGDVQLFGRATAEAQLAAKDLSTADSSTSMKDGSPSDSDGDGNNERPVREKLKQANLGTLHGVASDEGIDTDEDAAMGSQTTPSETENAPTACERASSEAEEGNTAPEPRGRPTRKRSFDDVDIDDIDEDTRSEGASGNKTHQGWGPGTHARKRSRDTSTGSGDMGRDEQRVDTGGAFVRGGSEEQNGKSHSSGFSKAKPTLDAGVRTPTEVMDEDREVEPVLSPRRLERKRSRDQFDKDLEKEELEEAQSREKDEKNAGGDAEPDMTARSISRTSRDEPEKKRHRDTSQEADSKEEKKSEIKIPPTSGFANTSTVSPFGTLTGKSPFASPGFGALYGSSTSPFGALGTSPPTSSPFGSLGAGKGTGVSGFGALLSAGKSGSLASGSFGGTPFGMTSSGFGALSGGFGGSTGAGLKDFSSNGSSRILGLKEKSPRPFGAPEDESEESGDEATDDEANGEDRRDSKDEKKADVDVEKRFHPQEVETGEEGEVTVFSCRAKLFYFDKGEKAWKERGVGLLKLNATVNEMDNEYDEWSRSSGGSEGEEADVLNAKKGTENTGNAENAQKTQNAEKRKARILMRADGVLRVVLNVPVFKGMKVGDEKGNPPTGRMVSFTALENGKAVPLLVKTSSPANAKELCKNISEIQEEL